MKNLTLLFLLALAQIGFADGVDSLIYKSGKVQTGTIENFDLVQNVTFDLNKFSFRLKENKKEKYTGAGLERVVYNGVTYVPAKYTESILKLMLPISVGKAKLCLFSGYMQMNGSTSRSVAFYSLEKSGKILLLYSKFESEYFFKSFKLGEYKDYKTKGINITDFYTDKSNTKRLQKEFAAFFGDCKELMDASKKADFNFADVIGIVTEYNECK